MDILQIMRGIALFQGLREDQLQRLLAISHEEVYQRGEAVFQQGDAGTHLYIVTQGQVQIVIRNMDGKMETKIYLGAGQIFGEIALIDYGPRTAAVIASHDDTHLLVISRDDMETLYQEDLELGFILMRNLAADIAFKLRRENLQR
jgi:CRP-like cAMP-binding protein